MYDPFAAGIIESIPDLEDLTPDETRRALSRAYFALVNLRLAGPDETPSTATADALFLRRLASTLESRAVFDTDVGSEERRASAFVAAEALSLLVGFREMVGAPPADLARIEREEVFARVEASLLYIIAGYDANAGGVTRKIASNASAPHGSPYKQAELLASEWTLGILIKLCTFHLNPLPEPICPVGFADGPPGTLADLEHDVRGRLLATTRRGGQKLHGMANGGCAGGHFLGTQSACSDGGATCRKPIPSTC